MNDYVDYNNEEVSRYEKVVDPREHNVVSRIKELENHQHIIVEDDVVTIDKMKSSHHDIIEESEGTDIVIEQQIKDIKHKIDDDIIVFDRDDE